MICSSKLAGGHRHARSTRSTARASRLPVSAPSRLAGGRRNLPDRLEALANSLGARAPVASRMHPARGTELPSTEASPQREDSPWRPAPAALTARRSSQACSSAGGLAPQGLARVPRAGVPSRLRQVSVQLVGCTGACARCRGISDALVLGRSHAERKEPWHEYVLAAFAAQAGRSRARSGCCRDMEAFPLGLPSCSCIAPARYAQCDA